MIFSAENASDYVRNYQTGSVLYYARGFAALHLIPIFTGFVACVLVVLRLHPARRWPAYDQAPPMLRGLLVWFVLAFLAVASFHASKNLRFVSVIYAPLYLLAADLLAILWLGIARPSSERRRTTLDVAVCVLFVALAVGDLMRFDGYFIDQGIPDLATPWFSGK